MVHIFFIISSYALSYKPLKQIHSQQFSALDTTLSSAVFRCAIRLFLPSFVILFLMALALHCELSNERYASSFLAPSSQLTHCWQTCWGLLRSLWAIGDIGYPQPLCNPALWTIPIEFAPSLLLFTVILGLSRCPTHIRVFLLASIIAVCFCSGQLYTVEFLGGMFLADVISFKTDIFLHKHQAQ
jgi:peptidoglycan/LPS O-acetylase OafA/YrhL